MYSDYDFIKELMRLSDTSLGSIDNFDNYRYQRRLEPTQIIFNDPATIVMWNDGSKTVVKCQPGDKFDKEKGLAMAYVKRLYNNRSCFNEVFKKWIEDEER